MLLPPRAVQQRALLLPPRAAQQRELLPLLLPQTLAPLESAWVWLLSPAAILPPPRLNGASQAPARTVLTARTTQTWRRPSSLLHRHARRMVLHMRLAKHLPQHLLVQRPVRFAPQAVTRNLLPQKRRPALLLERRLRA